MSLNIFSFIKGMLPIFKRSDVVRDMETSIEAIEVSVVPIYIMLEGLHKVGKPLSKDVKEMTKIFYENVAKAKTGVKFKSGENISADILTAFKNIKINGDFVLDNLDKVTSDAVVSEALSALKAFLFRAVAHYSFMSKFATDFANYIMSKEAENANKDLSDTYKINKKQSQMIEEGMWIFARLVAFYGQASNDFQSVLDEIPEMVLPKESAEDTVDAFSATKIEPMAYIPSGFVGSPIYSIRLVFAQWEADRFKDFKNKKTLLELRCLHLKMLKEQGDSDVNLEKQIEALQREVTDLDYKIAKMEEGLNG